MAFYAYDESKNDPDWLLDKAAYDLLEEDFIDLPIEEGSLQIDALVEELSFYNLMETLESFGTTDEEWAKELEEKLDGYPMSAEDYYESKYASDSFLLERDLNVAKELKKQFDITKNHQDYLDQMIEKSKDSISVSVFHKKDSFSYRNVSKTIQDYERLDSLDYKIGKENGIVSVSQFLVVDLCLIIILFIFIYYLFHYERETGLLPLLTSTKRGKLPTIFAKFGVLFVGVSILVLLFYGSLFILANLIYPFGDWNRPIQSMAAFKGSVFKLTVKEYVIVFLLLKYLVAILFSLVLTFLFTLFQRTIPVFFLAVGLLGASFVMYTHIHPGSYINGLKYVNMWAFLDTFHFLVEYRNLNVFGHPISKVDVSLIVGGSLIVLFALFICIGLLRQWTVPFPFTKQIHHFVTKMRRTFFRLRKCNFPFQHEAYKLLLYGKGWIVFVLGIVIMIQMLQVPTSNFTLNQGNYNEYLRELAGPLEDDKIQFIENESEKFATFMEKQENSKADYQNGLISREDYELILADNITFERKMDAFEEVKSQYEYLLFMKERLGYDVGFVSKMTSNYLFDSKGRDTVLAILLIVLLGSVLSMLFTVDYRNKAMNLLRVTKHGRTRLFLHKLLLACISVLCFYLLIYLPKYIILFKNYPAITWDLPIQSIEAFQGLSWPVSIWQFILVSHLFIIFGSLVCVVVMYALSILVRRQPISLVIFMAIFTIPLVISYIGFNGLDNLPWNAFFLAEYQLRFANATILASIYVLFIFTVGISMLLVSWKLFQVYKAGKE